MEFQAYTFKKDPSWAAVYITPPMLVERTPIHVCILLDVSWSMEHDNRLESFILSIQVLLDFLGPQDHISLITFSNYATIILNYINTLPKDREKIRYRLSIIQTDDMLNMGAAIIKTQEVLERYPLSTKQCIILITNGYANMGIYNTSSLISMTNKLLTEFPGTSLFTIAYGLNHDKKLLQTMAIQGSGTYTIVNTIEEIAIVFGDIVGGLLSSISQQIRVVLPKGTSIHSCYPINETATEMEIIVGDLFIEMEAIFFVQLPKGTSLELKGNMIKNNEYINMITSIIDTDNQEINDKNNLHYMRFQVVDIIKKIALTTFWNDVLRAKQKIDIHELRTNIYQYHSVKPHYLLELMINELNECMHVMELPYLHIHIHQLYRNSKVLGQQRGIPTIYNHKGQLSSLNNVYSNSIQQYFSTKLCKLTDEIQTVLHTKKVASNCLSPPLILRHHYLKSKNESVIEYIDMSRINKEPIEYTNMTIADVVNASR